MPSYDGFKNYSSDELIREVCKRLEEMSPVPEKGLANHAGSGIARNYCNQLLDAAKTTGLGGCQLCQS
jgi:hypothetical protein